MVGKSGLVGEFENNHYDDVMDSRELNAGLLKKVWNDFGLARRNEL
jgi:hypothetical protein